MSIALTLKELQLCPSTPIILRALADANDRLAQEARDMGFSPASYEMRAGELRAEAKRILNERAMERM